MKQTLLLLSGSKGRQQLLTDAEIPYQVLLHSSAEDINPEGLSAEELVCVVAKTKIDSVQIPEALQGEQVFALAADTLVFTQAGDIISKPTSKENAMELLTKFAQAPIKQLSGCCLRVYEYSQQTKRWETLREKTFFVRTDILYAIPPKYFDKYFEIFTKFMDTCGGARIETFGAQFTKWISGSYTNIQGLPMFEVREALEELGFKLI